LGFDYLLTPRVLVFFYWIAMLLIFVGGIYSMFTEHLITGFIGMIFSLIGCRVMFELIMVAFKNNEYLRRIAENTSVKSVE
jgi:Na+/phosphate symporter